MKRARFFKEKLERLIEIEAFGLNLE